MAIQLIGSEPDDVVPASFTAGLYPMSMSVDIHLPEYMVIPDNESGCEYFDTEAGVLTVSLKDLIEDYARNCLQEDGGDGLLVLSDFFEQVAPQLRAWHKSIPAEAVAAAKAPFDLVIPDGAEGF
ncbi:TPA: hypothetical protein NPQ06_003852 [Klebsiella pneumoniae]|nr:hypothetical protein [Klebsiella pneumoniae]